MFETSSEIIEIGKDNVSEVMKSIGHDTLKSGPSILETERHDLVSKISPWIGESGFQLIGITDTNLVISRESVHKG